MSNSLIMSVQANGENIIIGSNEQVKEKIKEMVHSLYQKGELFKNTPYTPYINNLLNQRELLIPMTTPFFKIRINPSGEITMKGFTNLEDVAIEISLTLSEI